MAGDDSSYPPPPGGGNISQIDVFIGGQTPSTPGNANYYDPGAFYSEYSPGSISMFDFGTGTGNSADQTGTGSKHGGSGYSVGAGDTGGPGGSGSGSLPGSLADAILGFFFRSPFSFAPPGPYTSSPSRLFGSNFDAFATAVGPQGFAAGTPPFFGRAKVPVTGTGPGPVISRLPGHVGEQANQMPQSELRQEILRQHAGAVVGIQSPYDLLFPYTQFGLPLPTDRGFVGNTESLEDFGFEAIGPGRFPALPRGLATGRGQTWQPRDPLKEPYHPDIENFEIIWNFLFFAWGSI